MTQLDRTPLYEASYIHFGDPHQLPLCIVIADPSCPDTHIASGTNTTLSQMSNHTQNSIAPIQQIRQLVSNHALAFSWIYTPSHGNGMLAAQLLYAAFDQGKFWEVHDLLFSSTGYTLMNFTVQDRVEDGNAFFTLFKGVLPESIVIHALSNDIYKSQIQKETDMTMLYKISTTPTVIYNEAIYSLPTDTEALLLKLQQN